MMLAVDRDVQRRAAVRILDVRPLAGGDQALDFGDVAVGGGGMQAGIDRRSRSLGGVWAETLSASASAMASAATMRSRRDI